MPAPPPKQIIGLDAIRCAAAVMVMVYHLGFWFSAGGIAHEGYGGYSVTTAWLAPYAWFGWVGVEVFFVLSGFVIAYSASGADAAGFLRSRVLRLVPAAWICGTSTLVVMALTGFAPLGAGAALRAWVATLMFTPFGPWIDWAYWTLGLEVAFYLVVYVLLRTGRFADLPVVVGVIGLVCVAFLCARLGGELWPGLNSLLSPQVELLRRLEDLLLLRHGCFFAIGVFLWLCLFDRVNLTRIGLIVVLVCGGLIEILAESRTQNGMAGTDFPAWVPALVWLGSLVLVVASVRLNGAFVGRFPGVVAPLRRLGLMTYPLYLLHQVIGFSLLGAAHGWIGDGVAMCLAMLVITVLAYVVSRTLEPPLRRAMARFLTSRVRAA